MTAISKAKAYRVTFEVRQSHYVDVLAVADWQAVEIARTLYEMGCDAVHAADGDFPEALDWAAEPLRIGDAS